MLGTWIAVFSTVQIVQSGILMSMGHPLVSPLTTLIGILAKLFCNYTLIRMPGINIYGAIIGNAATWLVAICLNQIYIQYKTQQKVPFIRHMMIPAASFTRHGCPHAWESSRDCIWGLGLFFRGV